jgi:diaminopimelate decarboxylase
MNCFNYTNGKLYAEGVSLQELADNYGTPAYVYSRAALEHNFLAYKNALTNDKHLICYAVKANSNIAVLNLLARLGSGFDIVSAGELDRVLAAGGDPAKVVFSGVAKTAAEMAKAIDVGIYCFNVESVSELELLQDVAAAVDATVNVSLRVNPDVDAKTHPYISTGLKENKFGIEIDEAIKVYRQGKDMPNLKLTGVDCHIGSQLTEMRPFLDAIDRVVELVDALADEGIAIKHLDLGGGLGVCYKDEVPPTPSEFLTAVQNHLAGRDLQLIFEPGRSITANTGILLTRVEYLKSNSAKNFAIIDAAMNDMLRPALYQAWMDIKPVQPKNDIDALFYDVVGPVCETGDFLGKDRELAIAEGDLLALFGAGAYGFTMASNYNSRGRPPEIIVDGETCNLVRARETATDLIRGETLMA